MLTHRKILTEFLSDVSPIAEQLVKRIEEKGIILVKLSDYCRFCMHKGISLPEETKGVILACECEPRLGIPKVIIINPQKVLHGLLCGNHVGAVEMGLAHEIGHLETWDEQPFCMFMDAPVNIKRRDDPCEYFELRAEEEGLKILASICGGLDNWKPERGYILEDPFEFFRNRISILYKKGEPHKTCSALNDLGLSECPFVQEITHTLERIYALFRRKYSSGELIQGEAE